MAISEPITGDADIQGGSWYAASKVDAPSRAPLTGEVDADVCIIGGGLAGLTAAREIARRDWSVVLLEGRRFAWNASGRNSGFVLPGFASDGGTLLARAGRERARTLWSLSEAGADYIQRTIRETGMPGSELSQHGWLRVTKDDNQRELADYARLLVDEFGAAVEFWPTERVRAELRSPLYFSGLEFKRAFTIHPLNYALGLAAEAEAAGARLFEDSPATEIDPAGVRKRVVTPTGRIRASQIVLAGNVHLGRVMPKISRTLFPVSSYVITTAPLGDQLHEAIKYRGAVSDAILADNHYRIVGGDRLVWSGRSSAWRGDPRRHARALMADIAGTYPQLKDVRAEYAWTGMLGNTVHRMPQIGELLSGVWLLSGFGGHGLNTTAMGGEMIARAITEGNNDWQLLAPFELVWAGGLLGRATLQTYFWTTRTRERVASIFARRREAERQRLDAAKVAVDATRAQVTEEEPFAVMPAAPATPAPVEASTEQPRVPRQRRVRRHRVSQGRIKLRAVPSVFPTVTAEEASPAAAAAPDATVVPIEGSPMPAAEVTSEPQVAEPAVELAPEPPPPAPEPLPEPAPPSAELPAANLRVPESAAESAARPAPLDTEAQPSAPEPAQERPPPPLEPPPPPQEAPALVAAAASAPLPTEPATPEPETPPLVSEPTPEPADAFFLISELASTERRKAPPLRRLQKRVRRKERRKMQAATTRTGGGPADEAQDMDEELPAEERPSPGDESPDDHAHPHDAPAQDKRPT